MEEDIKTYKLPGGWIKISVARKILENKKRAKKRDVYIKPPQGDTLLRSNNDIIKYVKSHPDVDIDPTLVNCQSVSTPTDGDGTKRFRTTHKFIEAVNALRAQNSPYECKDPSPYEVHGDEAVKRRKRGFFKRSESVTIKCEDIAPVSSTEVSPNRPENVTTKCEDVAPICATEVSTKNRDEVTQKRRSVASKCLAEVAPKSRDEVALKSCVVPTSCDLIAPKRSASLQPVQNHVLEVEKPTEEPSRFSSPVQIISPRDAAELSRLLLRPKSFPTPDFISRLSIEKGISYMTLLSWVQLKWPRKHMPEVMIIEDSSKITCPVSHLNVILEPES